MFDDLIETAGGGWGLAAAVVVGTGLLAIRGGRPLLKGALKGWLAASSGARDLSGNAAVLVHDFGTSATDALRGLSATVVEQAQDLYAESKAEVSSPTGPTAAASPGARSRSGFVAC